MYIYLFLNAGTPINFHRIHCEPVFRQDPSDAQKKGGKKPTKTILQKKRRKIVFPTQPKTHTSPNARWCLCVGNGTIIYYPPWLITKEWTHFICCPFINHLSTLWFIYLEWQCFLHLQKSQRDWEATPQTSKTLKIVASDGTRPNYVS